MHAWDDGDLGTHSDRADDRVVLYRPLGSALLRRYPGAIIYTAPHRPNSVEPDDTKAEYPSFRGSLDSETTFLGFEFKREDLLDWCFVIAEQPSEPRFGLDDTERYRLREYRLPDADNLGEPADDWNGLHWGHLFERKQDFDEATYAPGGRRTDIAHGGIAWGDNSAVAARQTFQQPVRVVIPAKRLLEPEPDNG